MRSRFQICPVFTLILLLVILSSCQPKPTTPTIIPEALPVQVSLLVSLDTPTQIKREGWNDYVPIGFGAQVFPTDLLKTTGEIALLCANQQTIKTMTNHGRNPCPLPQNDQTLNYDEMWFSPGARSPVSPSIPYILYPRSTTIVESHPLLQWHDTGAVNYTIEIRKGDSPIWLKKDATGDFLSYPNDAPALQAGKDYALVVTDNSTGYSSIEDPNPGLGFQIVSAEQRAEIEKHQQAILNLTGLDLAAQKMALALYEYNLEIGGRGLWGEASKLLKELEQAQLNAPAVHLLLGETLSKMKLWQDAQAVYETALAQAQTLKDLESQAEALIALWRITGEQASFNQAVSLFEKIGAKEKVKRLNQTQEP